MLTAFAKSLVGATPRYESNDPISCRSVKPCVKGYKGSRLHRLYRLNKFRLQRVQQMSWYSTKKESSFKNQVQKNDLFFEIVLVV